MKRKMNFAEKVKDVFNKTICKIFGHKIFIDAFINKEYGYEREYCKRCGYEKWNYVN